MHGSHIGSLNYSSGRQVRSGKFLNEILSPEEIAVVAQQRHLYDIMFPRPIAGATSGERSPLSPAASTASLRIADSRLLIDEEPGPRACKLARQSLTTRFGQAGRVPAPYQARNSVKRHVVNTTGIGDVTVSSTSFFRWCQSGGWWIPISSFISTDIRSGYARIKQSRLDVRAKQSDEWCRYGKDHHNETHSPLWPIAVLEQNSRMQLLICVPPGLVSIWNDLASGKPGLEELSPVKKFTDRATALNRIWKALQQHIACSNTVPGRHTDGPERPKDRCAGRQQGCHDPRPDSPAGRSNHPRDRGWDEVAGAQHPGIYLGYVGEKDGAED